MSTNPTKVVTQPGIRFSYANVFVPSSMEEGGKEKYSVTLLIPKSDTKTIAAINAAVEQAKQDGKSSRFNGKIPANLKLPLRDGDEERPDDPSYVGHYFLNANSVNKPGVVDANVQPIMNADDFYSGCYGRASVTFYAYNVKSMGIACGLQNVQKLADGERLAGGSSAEDDFGSSADDLM